MARLTTFEPLLHEGSFVQEKFNDYQLRVCAVNGRSSIMNEGALVKTCHLRWSGSSSQSNPYVRLVCSLVRIKVHTL